MKTSATAGPLLVTATVYVTKPPSGTSAGSARLVTATSVTGSVGKVDSAKLSVKFSSPASELVAPRLSSSASDGYAGSVVARVATTRIERTGRLQRADLAFEVGPGHRRVRVGARVGRTGRRAVDHE